MGGSGGSFSSYSNPSESANRIREAEQDSLDKSYDSEVNNNLNDILTDVNNRPVEEINKRLETIQKAIESDIDGFIDLVFGGSVNKHTYVDGLSDVDSLAILNSGELSEKTPHEVLSYFAERLQQRLPNTKISTGNLAVTVKYSDGREIQILPAIKTATGYKIAASDGSNYWSNVVKPSQFAEKLTSINKANGNKVVPVVKLAKSIISTLPESRKLSGYHTESLAIEVFKNYTGPIQTKAMLKHFFSEASKMVMNPISDSTGQSRHVDDYLGARSSTNRRMVSDSLSQISRRMNNADANRDSGTWSKLFE
ncbi:MAG TPA: CBASS oligonucleotide cyclase [Bacteroidales bacterium]|nr:CBASS oligonucleotide cyclase [Bacteroidales bacterium]